MEIKTIVESTDDIELLRSMCIERGSMILELNDKIDKLEDELEITNEVREIVKTISNVVSEWNELLFARVDVVRMNEKLVLMELELTEPWLFMQFRPAAGVDLFKALKKRIA